MNTHTRIDSAEGADQPPPENGSGKSWWATTWPLERGDWLHLGLALGIVVAIGVALGEILTNWSALTGVIDLDVEIAQNFAGGRTDTGNDLAPWGAFIANTPVKIALSLAIAGFFLWKFRRWHEAVMIGLPLIFEATAFIIITFIVQRPRPDVERLLDSPVNSSFPSGHVAAATVYAAIAVVVFWHTRALWARALAVVLAIAVPLIVAWARMYQGMHYLTDVIAGMVLGSVSVAIALQILGRPPLARVEQHHPDRDHSDGEHPDGHPGRHGASHHAVADPDQIREGTT